MAKTILNARDIQFNLNKLGYYDGLIDGDLVDENFRADLKTFQRDHNLAADGAYGPKSEAVILDYMSKLEKYAPKDIKTMRRWKLTYYWISNESIWASLDPFKVPMLGSDGKLIANVSARFFADVSLQGSGVLRDGRLVNVSSNPAYLPCDPVKFKPVFDRVKTNNWFDKPGYAGVRLNKDKTQAVEARCFSVVPAAKAGVEGYGMIRGESHRAFKTLATDIGHPNIKRSEPKFMNKGGTIPPHSKVFVLGMAGMKLPSGEIHNGECLAIDSGGGIFGAHIDVFTGSQGLAKKIVIPHMSPIWYVTKEGQTIEDRIPFNYSYGI